MAISAPMPPVIGALSLSMADASGIFWVVGYPAFLTMHHVMSAPLDPSGRGVWRFRVCVTFSP
ncbi:hypothetical protein ASG63_08455 [Methylobacterium sp. Leaf94]|nr:hypothetical protein ASG63_08455 [Methylobacterium sp. Leaf94]